MALFTKRTALPWSLCKKEVVGFNSSPALTHHPRNAVVVIHCTSKRLFYRWTLFPRGLPFQNVMWEKISTGCERKRPLPVFGKSKINFYRIDTSQTWTENLPTLCALLFSCLVLTIRKLNRTQSCWCNLLSENQLQKKILVTVLPFASRAQILFFSLENAAQVYSLCSEQQRKPQTAITSGNLTLYLRKHIVTTCPASSVGRAWDS